MSAETEGENASESATEPATATVPLIETPVMVAPASAPAPPAEHHAHRPVGKQALTFVRRIAQTLWFRVLVAIVFLCLHMADFLYEGKDRFGQPFNNAPGSPPAYGLHDNRDFDAPFQFRLLPARWDAGHYLRFALREYERCPERDLRPPAALSRAIEPCDLSFYPTYPVLGRLVSLNGRIPIDYALYGLSVFASFLFLVMWTSRVMVERLGLGGTYLSLLLFNAFTTGFTLVTIQTEPCVLALGLASFLLFARRRFLLGALFAGAASAFRINAIAFGMAFAAGVAVHAFLERPKSPSRTRAVDIRHWAIHLVYMAVCACGAVAVMAYHWYRFHDPLLYVHAHTASFGHSVNAGAFAQPELNIHLLRSIERPLHEGLWLVLTIVWLGLGMKGAMRPFSYAERAYWYVLTIVNIGLTTFGSSGLSFAGMNRYALLSFPLFFAMAFLLKRRPLLLIAWLGFSLWHYQQVDLCHYLAHRSGNDTMVKCHSTMIP